MMIWENLNSSLLSTCEQCFAKTRKSLFQFIQYPDCEKEGITVRKLFHFLKNHLKTDFPVSFTLGHDANGQLLCPQEPR